MSEPTALTLRESWRKRIDALKDFPQIWRLVWDCAPGAVLATLLLRVIGGVAPVAMLAVAKRIIDTLALGSSDDATMDGLWTWVSLEFALAAASQAVARSVDYCDGLIADRFTHGLGLKIMRHAASLDLSRFEDAEFYDRLERARVQTTDRIGMLVSAGWLVQRVVMLASLSAGIVYYAPWLLAVLVAGVAPAFLVESHFAFQGYTLAHSMTPLRRSMEYLLTLGSSRETAKEVKLFSLASYLEEKYSHLAEEVISKNIALATRRFVWGTAWTVLASTAYYFGYAYLIWQTAHGKLTLGTFTFLVGAMAGSNGHLQMIFSLFSTIADQALFLRDLLLFLRERPSAAAGAGLPAPRSIRSGLAFENVSFAYPGGDKLVVDNLSFRLEKGERVALVGENGQGKTTLVKLMTRLYEPSAGRILLDGRNLKDYDPEELRKLYGVIFQDFVRYDFPVRDNVGVGDKRKMRDDNALWEACRKSNAAERVGHFPEGLDQMLGRRFENGVDLSGGEWQRIALARAYLRDAQILILDEPSASLDPVAECEVFQNFEQLTQDKIALYISHRFSTVRTANRILVLSGGVIVEDGAHDRLVNSDGLYARLFEVQAASYR